MKSLSLGLISDRYQTEIRTALALRFGTFLSIGKMQVIINVVMLRHKSGSDNIYFFLILLLFFLFVF